MATLSPSKILQQLGEALPPEQRANVIVVGSLAAGYYFFQSDPSRAVATKDIDAMFAPHAKAVASAKEVTEKLFRANWTRRTSDPKWAKPGTAQQPTEELPLVRLMPPPEFEEQEWFLELLGAPSRIPSPDEELLKEFDRFETEHGHFALASFGYLGFAQWGAIDAPSGIRVARPSMMALANMLHHPRVAPDLMAGTPYKRSNKDLGRVLALAYLTLRKNPEGLDDWASDWDAAIQEMCPELRTSLVGVMGAGIEDLLARPTDLDEATRLCALGLLASLDVTAAMLRGMGQRVLRQIANLKTRK